MNNTAWNISVPGVGSIPDVTLECVKYQLIVCSFGLLSAAEKYANINFCGLLNNSPSEIL
jgi:hypothetical protein